MRIATSTIYDMKVQDLLNQQAALAKTQSQIATGKRVQTPADDPVAAAQLSVLTDTQAQQEQFGKNAVAVINRLQTEEQALADANSVLQRARELVVQANTATLSDADRASIATELKSRLDELLSIANRKDANGEYLFAGYSGSTQPFARGSGGAVSYLGDSGARSIAIDAGLAVADSDAGDRVFMNVRAGNGLFTTAAAAANTGSGVIDVGSIVNRAAWVPGSFTLSFTSGSTWQVADSSSVVVASGNYASGSAIAFNGVQVSISGVPATGDSFAIASAGTRDMFSTLDGIVSTLQIGAGSDALRAQLNSALNGSLQQLDQASEQLLTVRSQVGARLRPSMTRTARDRRS